jgi:hypothetical protein
VSGSDMRDVQQLPPFRAPNNISKYTTKELCSITTQYATSKGAAKPLPISGHREAVPSSSNVTPSNVIIQDAKKDAISCKKR